MKKEVKITPTPQGTYLVNGKEVYEDMDGNWACRQSLEDDEIIALNNFLQENILGIEKDQKGTDGLQKYLPLKQIIPLIKNNRPDVAIHQIKVMLSGLPETVEIEGDLLVSLHPL